MSVCKGQRPGQVDVQEAKPTPQTARAEHTAPKAANSSVLSNSKPECNGAAAPAPKSPSQGVPSPRFLVRILGVHKLTAPRHSPLPISSRSHANFAVFANTLGLKLRLLCTSLGSNDKGIEVAHGKRDRAETLPGFELHKPSAQLVSWNRRSSIAQGKSQRPRPPVSCSKSSFGTPKSSRRYVRLVGQRASHPAARREDTKNQIAGATMGNSNRKGLRGTQPTCIHVLV